MHLPALAVRPTKASFRSETEPSLKGGSVGRRPPPGALHRIPSARMGDAARQPVSEVEGPRQFLGDV